jgi:hypothetical protein
MYSNIYKNNIQIIMIGIFIFLGLFAIATTTVLLMDEEIVSQMAFAKPMEPCKLNC